MTDLTLFVGLDAQKKTISVAVVDSAAKADVRFYDTIANEPDAMRGNEVEKAYFDEKGLAVREPREPGVSSATDSTP